MLLALHKELHINIKNKYTVKIYLARSVKNSISMSLTEKGYYVYLVSVIDTLYKTKWFANT